MRQLTEKQAQMLGYIKQHTDALGYPPSLTDLSQQFEISLNAVVDRLHGLERKGAIRRTNGVARSIVIVE